jgi:hypothetical protein
VILNEQVKVDHSGNIHVVWVEHTEEKGWQGEAIWRAMIWSKTKEISTHEVMRSERADEPTLGSPTMIFGEDGNAYLFWNNGAGSSTGRSYVRSQDGGVSWTEPTSLFPGLSGQTGPAGLAIDSSGVLHLATAANGDGYGYGVVRYADLRAGTWSRYDTLPPDQFVGEHPSLVITGGNQLHLVWTQFEKIADTSFGRVSYSMRVLDAPLELPAGLTAVPSVAALASSSMSNAVVPLEVEVTGEFAEPDPVSLPLTEAGRPSPILNSGAVVLIGVLPVIALIVIVFASRRRCKTSKRYRRSPR